LKSWNISLQQSFSLNEENTYAKSFCFVYEQDLIAIGTKTGTVELYNTTTWSHQFSLRNHTASVKAICYPNDGVSVITGSKDGKLVQTNLVTKDSKELTISSKAPIKALLCPILTDGLLFISSGTQVTCYDLYSHTEICSHDFKDEIQTAIYLREEDSIVFGFKSGSVRVFSIQSRHVTYEHKEHTDKIKSLTKVKMGDTIAICSSSKDKKIKFLSIKTKTVVKTLNVVNKSEKCARGVIYAYDDKSVLSLHEDGKLIINNINSGNEQTEQSNKVFKIQSKEIITCGIYFGDSVSFVIGSKSGNVDVFTAK